MKKEMTQKASNENWLNLCITALEEVLKSESKNMTASVKEQ